MKKTGTELAAELTYMLNNMLSEDDEQLFVEKIMKEHRTLQQKAARLFLQCFVGWAAAKDNDYWDVRNRKTVELASKIRELLKEEGSYIEVKDRVVMPHI